MVQATPPVSFAQQLLRRRPSYTPVDTIDDASLSHSSVIDPGSPPIEDPDSRSSSMQSLGRFDTNSANRRKLLLIYLHGFMGNETSFQKLPAHVHNIVSARLASSHTVHTKVYPRYQAKNHINNATNAFSKWYDRRDYVSASIY